MTDMIHQDQPPTLVLSNLTLFTNVRGFIENSVPGTIDQFLGQAYSVAIRDVLQDELCGLIVKLCQIETDTAIQTEMRKPQRKRLSSMLVVIEILGVKAGNC